MTLTLMHMKQSAAFFYWPLHCLPCTFIFNLLLWQGDPLELVEYLHRHIAPILLDSGVTERTLASLANGLLPHTDHARLRQPSHHSCSRVVHAQRLRGLRMGTSTSSLEGIPSGSCFTFNASYQCVISTVKSVLNSSTAAAISSTHACRCSPSISSSTTTLPQRLAVCLAASV